MKPIQMGETCFAFLFSKRLSSHQQAWPKKFYGRIQKTFFQKENIVILPEDLLPSPVHTGDTSSARDSWRRLNPQPPPPWPPAAIASGFPRG
jgi:hypothetical protein